MPLFARPRSDRVDLSRTSHAKRPGNDPNLGAARNRAGRHRNDSTQNSGGGGGGSSNTTSVLTFQSEALIPGMFNGARPSPSSPEEKHGRKRRWGQSWTTSEIPARRQRLFPEQAPQDTRRTHAGRLHFTAREMCGDGCCCSVKLEGQRASARRHSMLTLLNLRSIHREQFSALLSCVREA